MWAAFIRQFTAYALTRRGKKFFALIGVLLLCFGAALLIDLKLYVSAAFTTLLALFSAVAYVVQHVKLKRVERERLTRKAEAARLRALAAQARLDLIDDTKGAIKNAAHDAATRAAQATTSAVSDAATQAGRVVAAGLQTVSLNAQAAAARAETAARTTVMAIARSWRAARDRAGFARGKSA